MARAHTFLGIDIGGSSIKLVELAPGPARARLVRATTVPLDGGGAAAELADERIRDALRGGLARAKTRPTIVACAVPTRSAAVREVTLPHAGADDVDRMIRFEAERFIPFPPDQMTMDHYQLPGDVADATRVLVVATRTEAANRLLGMLSGLGLPHPRIDVTAIASFNALTADESTAAGETCAIVDVGAEATDIVIADSGTLVTARSTPAGGEDLTRAYQEDLSIDFGEAETQKREHGVKDVPAGPVRVGASAEEQPEAAEAGPAHGDRPHVAAWLGRVAGEIRHTIESFHRNSEHRVQRVILCGGGALAPGLPEALETALGVPATLADPWHGVEVLRGSADAPDALFATACGLALKAAGRAALDVNLTPEDVRDRRATRQRASTMTAIGVTAGVLVAASVAAVWLLLGAKERKLAELEQQLRSFGIPTEQIALSEEQLARYGAIEASIDKVLLRDARPLDVVRDITLDMPEDVWVTEFSYDADKGVVVRGTAASGPSVSDSVRALLNTDRFGSVVLDYYNLAQIAEKPVYNFQISCQFPEEGAVQ
ncbi:MAG: type IV pilus assembly protein PilM [Armatimonadota bacterium]